MTYDPDRPIKVKVRQGPDPHRWMPKRKSKRVAGRDAKLIPLDFARLKPRRLPEKRRDE